MNHDAIIFDIDGTLWNASSASANGWNKGLAKLGIEKTVSAKQIEDVAGLPFEECIETLFPGLLAMLPHLLDILNEAELENVKDEGGIFYNGVLEGIKQLSKSHPIFLVSNCQDWYLELFLEKAGLASFITDYNCNGMSGLPKHKMLTNMIVKHSLNNPVYVGDTEGDESACAHAKIDFIHVSYGFGSAKNKPQSFNSFTKLLANFNIK